MKKYYVVQRIFGVDCESPDDATEMTKVKTAGVTAISINVQPSAAANPAATDPAKPTVDQPTPAMNKRAERLRNLKTHPPK